MRLLELEPQFLHVSPEEPLRKGLFVDTFAEAQGVPDEVTPGPARWAVSGTSLEDLTLSPSILLAGGCGWHGFITKGLVTGC